MPAVDHIFHTRSPATLDDASTPELSADSQQRVIEALLELARLDDSPPMRWAAAHRSGGLPYDPRAVLERLGPTPEAVVRVGLVWRECDDLLEDGSATVGRPVREK